MAINFKIEYKEGILYVTTKGFDEKVEDVLNYSNSVAKVAFELQSQLILCDERELEYRLSTIDTFQVASYAAKFSKYPVKIAIVFNEKYEIDAKFYQTVTNNRGLQVKMFRHVQEAENWLKNKHQI